jgi:opine dehydrogenase
VSRRIAVIGGGNGALTVAGAAALDGHRVRLWDRFLDRHPKLLATGEITLTGSIEGTAHIDRPRDDLAWTIDDADLIEVTVPGFALAWVASVLMPLVSEGQAVLLHPGGTGGSLEVTQLWDEALEQRGATLGATDTLAYAARLVEENVVQVHAVKKYLMVASSRPARLSGLVQLVSEVHPMAAPAGSVMEVALSNLNPVIHPPVTLLNAGRIESGQSFSLYGDGVVPSAATLMKAIDRERLTLAAASEVQALPLEDWIDRAYGVRETSLVTLFSRMDERVYGGLRAPTTLASRYLTEDIPLGLEVFVELAAGLALDLPITESVVRMARVLISQMEGHDAYAG